MTSAQIEWIARAKAVLHRNRAGASLAFGAQGMLFATLLTHVPQFKSHYDMGDGGITVVILIVSIIAGAGSVSAEKLAHRYSSREGLPVVAPLCFSACGTLALGHADQVVARVNIFNYLGSIVGGVAVGGIGTASSLRYGFIVPAVLALLLLLLAPAFNPEAVT
jgi:hypothetical protein